MREDIPQSGAEAPCTQLDHESDDAYALFEAYAALPPARRRIDTVAAATGYSAGTLANYSSAYRWRERAEECDRVDELRVAYGKRRMRLLLLDRASQLGDDAEAAELIKVSRALDRYSDVRPANRYPQSRDGGGRFAPSVPLPPKIEPDPACECRNPECRAALVGCTGGYCSTCGSGALAS